MLRVWEGDDGATEVVRWQINARRIMFGDSGGVSDSYWWAQGPRCSMLRARMIRKASTGGERAIHLL
jgi:hypothetical protein